MEMADNRPPMKFVNDPIHGLMEVHPLVMKFINTPEFHRLRNIKQLGECYYVYPGASHNRFEHSIGVSHLAGVFANRLKTKQPELEITDVDVLCVEIAGLCHDLGHGPFSHLFDREFIPKARPGFKWKHEYASLKMFDHLVESNNLTEEMKKYKVMVDDIAFIKSLMMGDKNDENGKAGRENKLFLYEIVANTTNSIDVDKFDYLARDCHHLGMSVNFDHKRFFMFAKVLEVEGQQHICMRDTEKENLDQLFNIRARFHRRAYQHKINRIIQNMITDAFLKADEYIRFEGRDGKRLRLSETVDDMVAYTKVTDAVFEEIQHSASPDLEAARNILKRIVTRNFDGVQIGEAHPHTIKKKNLFFYDKNGKAWREPDMYAVVTTNTMQVENAETIAGENNGNN